MNLSLSVTNESNSRVCPWWFIRSFDNPVRTLFQNPEKILRPFVRPGDRCLDVGCGYGYFAVPLARLVGPTGTVTAVDIQPEMLAGTKRRVDRSGLSDRVTLRLLGPDGLAFDERFDFALAFWMMHEVPDQKTMLSQLGMLLKPAGTFLLVEPRMHVDGNAFNRTAALAQEVGFTRIQPVHIFLSRGILMSNGPTSALHRPEVE